ncbi:hypothetical protein TRFO_08944 [Tritrichomonas foetus]|uniref:F5/8 type C domain-containing protein n=1 Tax=Tritrichomonas foetus TaxID=1144522 RepID=A0A1J4JLB3_9EUKA|nr:hypothetical protein TRFO_08944 [Tritrichomonas foetus]|eukprot:OHS98355.1 hypothetical protein TRFO_08944 [Tritrichomonas foetus]
MKFALSTASMHNLNIDQYKKNFTFIINGKKIRTPSFIADILSPKISQIHKTDPTFNQFTIETNQSGVFENIIDLVKDLDTEKEITIEERDFYYEVLKALGNTDYYHLVHFLHEDEITLDNVFQRIHEKMMFYGQSPNYQNDCDIMLGDELQFVAMNFFLLKNSYQEIHDLNMSQLKLIFENSQLKLETEDSLVYFIFEHIEYLLKQNNKKKYMKNSSIANAFYLFEHVEFDKLTSECLDYFMKNFDINYITIDIFRALCKYNSHYTHDRYRNNASNSNFPSPDDNTTKRYKPRILKFEYNEEDNNINGILAYLTKEEAKMNKSHKDMIVHKYFNITSSSFFAGSEPENLFKTDEHLFFTSLDSPNQNVIIEFLSSKIIISHYLIKTVDFLPKDYSHPRSWKLEVSLDGTAWVEIDKRNNEESLNHAGAIGYFPVNQQYAAMFVKLTQTGENWADNDQFCFSNFELFGQLDFRV